MPLPPARDALLTVVIATRDRRARLLRTLARLVALPERPPIIVVDNGSADDTPAAVRRAFPGVRVITLEEDAGSAARTVGLLTARSPLVAFTDDDSWWAPGALERAGALFSEYPRLGLVAARIHVEPGGRLDPTCATMRASPIRSRAALPGPPVLGFLACAAIARRDAVLECGGFHPRFGFGGEEHLLAVDLAAAGWGLAYVDDVVAHHEPAPGTRTWISGSEQRNVLWSAWLRRPLRYGARLTFAHAVRRDGRRRRALVAALGGLPWVIRERRVLPAHVEDHLRLLERAEA
jgi:N-acetylglucosaminyl-diphospho-decaprenol L-rhamnosyltransferase